jgi:hypothetical protein
MSRCSRRMLRHLGQLAYILLTLGVDAIRVFRLGLRSPAALAAEKLFLGEQLALYQERNVKPKRAADAARCTLVWLSHWFDWQQALTVVQPQTFMRGRRQGWGVFWRWKARPSRPRIPVELQALIHQIARDNVTWGQRRITNALRLKLGLRVSPRPVRKYTPSPPDSGPGQRVASQRWRTFMRNHVWGLIASYAYATFPRDIQALSRRVIGALQRRRDACHRRASSAAGPHAGVAVVPLADIATRLKVEPLSTAACISGFERSPPRLQPPLHDASVLCVAQMGPGIVAVRLVTQRPCGWPVTTLPARPVQPPSDTGHHDVSLCRVA